MFALGRGRVDSAFEQWVLWELPLSRALQYHHAALRYAGEWTVPLDLLGDKDKLIKATKHITDSFEEEEDDELGGW